MAKFFRIFFMVFMASVLSGCILQSKTPLFKEAEGVLLLGQKKQRFASYERDGATWKKGTDTAIFDPQGHHYNVSSGKNYATAEFISLGREKYVMQFDEGKGSFVYILISPHGKEILLYALLCDSLKKQNIAGVRFDKDNCFIEPSFGRSGFETLLKNLPAASLKLQAE